MAKDREELELVDDGEALVLEEEAAEPERPRKDKDKARHEKAEHRKSGKPVKEKKRGGFWKRIGATFSELKKVTWPTFKEVVKKTGVVLVVVTAFLVVIYGVDALLTLGMTGLNPPTP